MGILNDYMERNKKVGYFGIKYLDYKLRGILRADLILIGARSGAGKSSIANSIAIHNRNLGQKVALFSLENFQDDSFVECSYYEYMRLSNDYSLHLRDFASGDFDRNMFFIDEAEKYAEKTYKDIYLINRQKDYGISNLKDDIIKAVEEHDVKLIVLDHLDYIDKYNNENDNQHMNELMKTLRHVQDAFRVAIVAVSHLRKPITKEAPVIPSMDEFIGTSNKTKEATAVIMLAPDDEGNMMSYDKTVKSTWCCVRKLRMGGFDNISAKLMFHTRTGKYADDYARYRVNYSGSKVEEIL